MRKEPRLRVITFRKDTFLQKISRVYSSLMIHGTEELKNIDVRNNSVVLKVGEKGKK